MTLPSFSRLSTGWKMLLILTVALLPLGIIAIFASIESAQTASLRRIEDARQTAGQAARRLSTAIGRTSLDLRAVTARLDYAPMTAAQQTQVCRAMLAGLQAAGRRSYAFGVFRLDGRLLCRTDNFSGLAPSPPQELFATEVRILPRSGRIQFEARSPGGTLYGVAEAPVATIAAAMDLGSQAIRHGIALRQSDERLTIRAYPRDLALGRQLMVAVPVASGQITLELTTNAVPIGAVELLLAVLPILMWLAAALIGWLVVERLMIAPLRRLQQIVATYRPEDGPVAIPHFTTPAREIRELGEAFRTMTDRIGLHEAELAAGLHRQTRLTREVHHRVKNNLQVVASLISIHARGADDPAVANAYASIQRRVDALSVVHRNHFAELEANRGVGLRALIGELAANLRATAGPGAGGFGITLDLTTAFCTQDVAVPVAFLITEIVEVAMHADPRGRAVITLMATERADRALLAIASPALVVADDVGIDPNERFRRVIEGLSRQLRTKLAFDADQGRYAIEIGISPDIADD